MSTILGVICSPAAGLTRYPAGDTPLADEVLYGMTVSLLGPPGTDSSPSAQAMDTRGTFPPGTCKQEMLPPIGTGSRSSLLLPPSVIFSLRRISTPAP